MLVKIKTRFKTKNLSPNFFKPIINSKASKSYSRKEHKMCSAVNINYIMCQLCSPRLPDPSTLLHLLCAQQADLCQLHQQAASGFRRFAPGEPQQDSRGGRGPVGDVSHLAVSLEWSPPAGCMLSQWLQLLSGSSSIQSSSQVLWGLGVVMEPPQFYQPYPSAFPATMPVRAC